jgi:hypothetical protein
MPTWQPTEESLDTMRLMASPHGAQEGGFSGAPATRLDWHLREYGRLVGDARHLAKTQSLTLRCQGVEYAMEESGSQGILLIEDSTEDYVVAR